MADSNLFSQAAQIVRSNQAGGYSTPPGSVGSSWASRIHDSRPTGGVAPGAAPVVDDPLMAPVYMGMVRSSGSSDVTPQGFGSHPTTSSQASEKTIDQLLTEFEEMDRKEQHRLAFLLTIAGYAGSVSLEEAAKVARELTLGETIAAYTALLTAAAAAYASRGQRITPNQILEGAIAYRLPRGTDWDGTFGDLKAALVENDIDVSGIDEEEDLSGTHTTTSTDTSVSRDIMDPNDAMALTRAMIQRELGRDPTKAEFEDFISAVQAAQRANPTRTKTTETTTVTTDKDGKPIDRDSSSSSTTRGGISQAGVEDILLRRARQNPDWAEWQAVGTYAPALFAALGATVPGI